MSQFTLGAQELGDTQPSGFGEFINIVSGRSVISGADWGNDKFELGLSGDGMIRVFWRPDGLHVNFISTTNADEIPPLILQLIDEDRRLPARVLEKRLFGMRQLYAIVRLADTDRLGLLEENLDSVRDLEDLLEPEEQLYVECLAPGSWYLTGWSKLKGSYMSVVKTVALVYGRGREALLSKLEAEARLKALEAEEKEFELLTKKLDYTLALSERIGSDNARKALEERVLTGLEDFLLRNRNSEDVREASRRLLK